MKELVFSKQVALLLEVLGTVAENRFFVLKGGTAINFFHSNMPRLSVDIDLAYTKINSREQFLQDNEVFWQQLLEEIPRRHNVQVRLRRLADETPLQMYIQANKIEVKIEANLVLRGTIYPTVLVESCDRINEQYRKKLKIETLSIEELYAGKFCAALDRQHPRDLFDVWVFFNNHTFSDKFKKAFLVYLISANRPIAELINPNRLDQRRFYETEFHGMPSFDVSYQILVEARENLINTIESSLTEQDRIFLLGFKSGEPDWGLLGIDGVNEMPSIKWKLRNIVKMDPEKHIAAVENLKKKLGF